MIPQSVLLRGTVRTMEDSVRAQVEARIRAIAEGTALAMGGRAELSYHRGYPVTVNAPDQTDFAAEVAAAISGRVERETPPLLAAEDFSYMLNARPGAYIFVGNGDTAGLHHPEYTFDEAAIPFGASWYAAVVEGRLPRV